MGKVIDVGQEGEGAGRKCEGEGGVIDTGREGEGHALNEEVGRNTGRPLKNGFIDVEFEELPTRDIGLERQ